MVINLRKISFISLFIVVYIILINVIITKKTEEVATTFLNDSIDFYVDAESCIVMNDKNEILYSKNIHNKLLPASITKILTCITAIENIPLDNYVYITYDMVNTIGSKIYLQVGDYIKLEDLLYGLMLSSGNDAANAIALSYSNNMSDFIYLMNKLANKIGMTNSTFNNPSGLDSINSNYTTAYDMALLTNYALKNEAFCKIFGAKNHIANINDRKLYFRHKHRLIHTLDEFIGGKTGYTEKAGRTLVSSFEIDDEIYTVVTFNSHNDWQIHANFKESIKSKKNYNSSKTYNLSLLKPFSERLRGKKDD